MDLQRTVVADGALQGEELRARRMAMGRNYKGSWDGDGEGLGEELRARLMSIDQRLEKLSQQMSGGVRSTSQVVTQPASTEAFAMFPHQVQTEMSDNLRVIGSTEDSIPSPKEIPASRTQGSFDSEAFEDFDLKKGFSQVNVWAANKDNVKSKTFKERMSVVIKERILARPLFDWFHNLRRVADEVEKPSTWHLVHSKAFEAASCLVIVINAVFVGFSGTVQLQETAFGAPQHAWIDRVEAGFCVCFTCELLIRFIAERPLLFFLGGPWAWNAFDCLIVTASIFEIMINGIASSGVGVTIGRLLRIVRLIRVFRMTRVMRHFNTLRVLVLIIINSLGSLFWCFATIGFILYMYAVLLLFGLIDHFQATGPDVDLSELKDWYGGGVPDIMLSLFMAITGGFDWQESWKHFNQVHQAYGWIYLSYIGVMVFGVLNVVVANFVKGSMDYASRDRETFVQDQAENLEHLAGNLIKFFKEADDDDNGVLGWEEFKRHMQCPEVQSYFSALELDITQAHKLFDLLDVDGDKEVSLDEFLSGCMRLRGMASNVDINVILMQTKRLNSQIASLRKRQYEQLSILKEMNSLGVRGGAVCEVF